MINKKTIIKHLTSNKKYYYYFGIIFFILSLIIVIRVYVSIPIKTRKKLIPNTIKDVDVTKIHDCPDYWDLDFTNGKLNYGICNNTHNLGTCKDENGTTIQKLNFNEYLNTLWGSFKGAVSSTTAASSATSSTTTIPSAGEPSVNNNLFNLKNKCKWAKKCKVTWDIVDSLC